MEKQRLVESTFDHGKRVEDAAAHYLCGVVALQRSEDWQLLAQNFRFLRAEIDQVWEVQDGKGWILVFVEVRSRLLQKRNSVGGVESVGYRKRKHLLRAATGFLLNYSGPAHRIRFDVLAWNGWSWDHRIDAFRPD